MIEEQRRLLDTIIDNPDEDAPRLVYADWLEEREQVGRAKFIREGCTHKQEQKASYRWIDYPISIKATWRRGFVEAIQCERYSAWRSDGQHLLSEHPVRRVTLGDKTPWESHERDEEHHGWWSSATSWNDSSYEYCNLDPSILIEMAGDPRRVKTPVDYRYPGYGGIVAFRSAADAVDALSDALIQVARQKLKQGVIK